MGFFDRNDNDEDEKREEVTLSVPEDKQKQNQPSGQLKDEAEARLTGSSDDSSEEDTSGMLPGMGADTGTSASPSNRNSNSSSSSSRSTNGKKESVSLEDIHRQNKQIKSILKDIRSEIKDEGDMNGVL